MAHVGYCTSTLALRDIRSLGYMLCAYEWVCTRSLVLAYNNTTESVENSSERLGLAPVAHCQVSAQEEPSGSPCHGSA